MDTLVDLAKARPRTARALVEADRRRRASLQLLASGARLRGFEELLLHLDALVDLFQHGPQDLQRIASLVDRAVADFETGLEATLSGYFAVVSDSMRDVMELENLLLDFAREPALIDRWLTADRKTIRREFAPVVVRKRLGGAGASASGAKLEAVDYAAHSEALHVTPGQHPLASKGLGDGDSFRDDAGFWEMFQHAHRLINAIEALWDSAGGGPLDRRVDDLEAFRSAWERTQEMQAIYVALLQGAATAAAEEESDD